MSSFLFSVTNNHKMTLNKKLNAIYGYPNYGPTFGNGCNFNIYNQADRNISYENIGHSYVHSDYSYDTQEC